MKINLSKELGMVGVIVEGEYRCTDADASDSSSIAFISTSTHRGVSVRRGAREEGFGRTTPRW